MASHCTSEKKAEAQMTNELRCGVCLKRYRSPKLLPCFHTFCEICVEKVADSKPSFPCPACGTVTVMPPGGSKELRANVHLEMLLIKCCQDDVHFRDCELCSEGREAEYRCVQCQQVCCSQCRSTHDLIPLCASHTVLALSRQDTDGEMNIAQNKCSKHRGKPLVLFCCECERSICIQCKLTFHDGHETEDVADSGERARAELTEELQALARKEQVLRALLTKLKDFQEDLQDEKHDAETAVRDRVIKISNMLAEAEKEALESVSETTEDAADELREQETAVRKKHEAVVARHKHIAQLIEKADDSEAVSMLAQMNADKKLAKSRKSHKGIEELAVQRKTLVYEFKSSAVKYGNISAFVGLARAGSILKTKASSLDAECLQEAVQPCSFVAAASHSSFKKRDHTKGEAPSFVEIVYSRNPKARLSALHLLSDETVWMRFNPGGSVNLFGLFDNDGKHLDLLSEDIPSSDYLVTCKDDTVVCLTDGRWFRSGGGSGKLTNFTPRSAGCSSKSATCFLLQASSVYKLQSTDLPPKISPDTLSVTTLNSVVGFDASAEGKFFAIAHGCNVTIFDKLASSTTLRQYATYIIPGNKSVSDVCFCFMDGEELLLVAISAANSVHVVDHRDGCCLVRTLETDQCKLTAPCRLTTNHKGRVWVGCNGGKLVIFDV